MIWAVGCLSLLLLCFGFYVDWFGLFVVLLVLCGLFLAGVWLCMLRVGDFV